MIVVRLSRENLELALLWLVVLGWSLGWLPCVVWLLFVVTFGLGFSYWQVAVPFALVYSVIISWLMLDYLAKRGTHKEEEVE